LSYEENSSLSTTVPVLLGLVESLTKEPESESEAEEPSLLPAIFQFKRVVAEEITRRCSLDQLDTNDPMILAPLVDPRFKLIQSFDKEVIKTNIEQFHRCHTFLS